MGPVHHPAHPALGVDDAVFVLQRGSGATQLAERLAQAMPVVGVDDVQQPQPSGVEGLRVVPGDRLDLAAHERDGAPRVLRGAVDGAGDVLDEARARGLSRDEVDPAGSRLVVARHAAPIGSGPPAPKGPCRRPTADPRSTARTCPRPARRASRRPGGSRPRRGGEARAQTQRGVQGDGPPDAVPDLGGHAPQVVRGAGVHEHLVHQQPHQAAVEVLRVALVVGLRVVHRDGVVTVPVHPQVQAVGVGRPAHEAVGERGRVQQRKARRVGGGRRRHGRPAGPDALWCLRKWVMASSAGTARTALPGR